MKSRWYYDQRSSSCQRFLFGGCQGNANNFESEAACLEKCLPPFISVGGANTLPALIPDGLPSIMPAAPMPGGMGIPGAPHSSNIDAEVKMVAAITAKQLTGVSAVANQCNHANLIEVVNVQKQVVAGTNFILTLKMTTKSGPDCEILDTRECSNIVAQKPLPFNCQSDDMCIEIIRQDEISCTENEFVPPGGGLILPPGGMILGGPQPSPIDDEAKMVASEIAKQLAGVSTVSGDECDHASLLEVVDVQKQVVAGTNFILTLKMTTKSGPDCETLDTRVCSNIVAHKPLPFNCQSDDMCIELLSPSDIECRFFLDLPPPPEVPAAIAPENEDRCLMEKKIGRCRAGIRRVFFNTKTKKCEPFLFGGCQGNGNNFVSTSECEDMCKKHMAGASNRVRARFGLPSRPVNEKCTLAMDAGPCFALKPRYYYNPASRRCEEFLYGGCRGNANNFETLQACVSECGKQLRGRPELPLPPPKCTLGNHTYAVGDIVRLGDDPCKSCVCSSPPDLTCSIKKCPAIAAVSSNARRSKTTLGVAPKASSAPGDSNSGSSAGSFPILGGFSSSRVDGEAKKVAAVAARQLLTGVTAVTR